MIQKIRTSKVTKVVAVYLAMMLFLEMVQPMAVYALTSGPTQPEFNAFTPVGTSDMVDLTSGNFNYNIPIMDVGGYPINLAYDSGITMDQEASWVGLGWNLNVGQIQRQIRGLPDDFRGDQMEYENDLRDNVTVGTNFNVSPALFGNDTPFNLGLGVQYNNYEGITFRPSIGVTFALSDQVQVGMDLSATVAEGATLSPSVSFSKRKEQTDGYTKTGMGFGTSLSSRKGLESMSMSSFSQSFSKNGVYEKGAKKGQTKYNKESGGSVNAGIAFNNQSYTPAKRIAFDNVNKTFNATLGGELFGLEGQVRISGYGSYQSINSNYKNRKIGAYGYENTQYKNDQEGVLDFNREKEQTVSKNTTALPVTNYTYDIYSIQGQGISGTFRPNRGQVGYLYNDDVADFSLSGSFGAEFGAGNLVHGGVNFTVSPSTVKTGIWSSNNNTLPIFTERNTDKNDPLYEQTTFKLAGELSIDEESLYVNKINQSNPMRLKMAGGDFNRSLEPVYQIKKEQSTLNPWQLGSATYIQANATKIKRVDRLLRNKVVQKITANEADDVFVKKNIASKGHHTAGIKILQEDGSTYIYGKSVYNTKKIEATFDVSGRTGNTITGIVPYNGNVRGNGSEQYNSDKYVNKIITPEYAHSYLLTSTLSSDYEDIDHNGPSDKDLGTYTKFSYTSPIENGGIYKWRIPYGFNEASYNEGLKTSVKDQKGNYIYGEKQLSYLKTIETKTHVAFIDLQKRDDARAVNGENGGGNSTSGYMYSIKSIRLYSKSELSKDAQGNLIDPLLVPNTGIKPIKTAHFEYSYQLCKNTPNNFQGAKGKLTLEKLYFTYRSSNMGKYTPYVFNYGDYNSPLDNPDYDMKGFDIWGNYKKNGTGLLSTAEDPYVVQDKDTADKNTASWTLKKVKLPSGGELTVTTESDDYKYVQNKKAMQMFNVVGAGDQSVVGNSETFSTKLYSGRNHRKYLYVKLKETGLSGLELEQEKARFFSNYLSEQSGKSIYFKFLLNMNEKPGAYDFVSGYFEIDEQTESNVFQKDNKVYAAIPLKFLKRDGGLSPDVHVNPIAKAGWGFGRSYLNRAVYSLGGDEVNNSFISIVEDLVGSIGAMIEIFEGPNKVLETKGCASNFKNYGSWIRLQNPKGKKLGGGLRVKSIELSDNWDVMNSETTDVALYKERYGQTYSYTLEDGITSSGVATFEPNASNENPFVEPFYNKNESYEDLIGSPKEMNYVEKPFGENFFPAATVTYSRVTVSNIDKKNENGSKVLGKHATGNVVTEHYTSYDFPTLVNYTDISMKWDQAKSPLSMMLDVYSADHLTAVQGFSIETNDMNGKLKSEKVYAQGQSMPISKVEYKYSVDTNGKLNNNLPTIDARGIVKLNLLGVNYDVIHDFNESSAITESFGGDGNVAGMFFGVWPAVFPNLLPKYAYHDKTMRTATTTKVINKIGILKETIAYDLGSKVSTKNLAWDAKTGQVILTQTINEFDDNYYNFNFPAYWYYNGMGFAAENVDMAGTLKYLSDVGGISYFGIDGLTTTTISKYFKVGDELVLKQDNGQFVKLWVFGYNTNASGIKLMDKEGRTVTNQTFNVPENLNFRVIRSGNRNQQMNTMSSVTLMTNHIDKNNDGVYEDITDATFAYTEGAPNERKVINASAVEYSDNWSSQCENDLPNEAGLVRGMGDKVNPFIYNIQGDWRAVKSYVYLTGRNNFITTNRRKAGYFVKFSPLYKLNTAAWSLNTSGWTSASQVTKYSPYGIELENKDALNRYSAAQYGYNYKLPVAVASNAQYKEIGFDGFEDYDMINPFTGATLQPHFGFTQQVSANAQVTNIVSHTGTSSLAVKPGQGVKLTRKINGCKFGETIPKNKVKENGANQEKK